MFKILRRYFGAVSQSGLRIGGAGARLVLALAVFMLVISAMPVIAAEGPGEPPQEIIEPPTPEGFDPSKLPGEEDVSEAIEKAEREEEDREAWLESPEAVHEREESRLAYTNLDTAGVGELLSTVFAGQLAQLNTDPARFLSDAQLISSSEPTSATVKDEGNGLVMDSSLPVQTEDEGGDLRKVDLSLEEATAGWQTTNALVDVSIPDSAGEPVEVGEEGVAIELVGADEGRALQPFGDENVLATEVLPDTDMLVSPIATGVEIFNVLRSENSPEALRFGIKMPTGAQLRGDGRRGAEVVKDGELLATIPEPVAVDGQGTDVPVGMAVEGDSVVLTVNHREGDYAMPILLDPILENNENWIYGQNHNALDMGVWGFNKNVAGMYGSTYCIYHCFGQPSNVRGLFVSGQSGTYWPNQFAQWSYSAPNVNSFVETPTLSPYVRYDHGCNAATTSYKEPHDYFGVWGHNGQWVYTSINSANQPGNTYTLPFRGLSVIFGLGSGGSQFSIPCWRDLYAGGAHVWLDDWNPPWIEGGLAGISGRPSDWVSNETPFTITAVAKDEGLGIKNVRIHQQGGEIIYDIPPQNECAGTRRSPCNTTHTASFDNIHGGYFFPGERDVWLNANDPTGKYIATDHHWTMRVDNTPPEMNLKGQFAEATSELGSAEVPAGKGDQLSLPVYKLEVEAKDGSWDNPLNKRSGVKDIEIYLDGVEQSVPWEPQPCSGPNYSCEMKKTYPVQLSKLTTSGKHVLKVEAVDQVGKRLKRELEFEYFPATGMKDEYVMHYFPLPDGTGNEAEEEHPDRPELAVNVMNGNLVYRETDIDVEGTAAVDLEVERYYNSMLPENEDTEWGDGWTLAQTPKLEPEESGGEAAPTKATMLRSTAAYVPELGLPTDSGQSRFDPALRALVTKQPGGGYLVEDETGEAATATVFDASGKVTEERTEGYAKVEYRYDSGELAEIEVSDPATFAADPSELEIPEPELITEPTYDSVFGSNGSGDGQLKSPGDVAVDSQGNLWVIDKANNRVQKFDAAGKFLAKFGSLGSGDGQFNRPTAVTIAANGDLLVTDSGNGRVQRFSSAGAYLSKFGAKGTGNGQFAGSGPEGIAIDAAGNIWVSDTYGGRVQKFNSAGEFIKVAGSKGSGTGQLGEPTGIDVAPNGDVWVADWQNHRVSIFNTAGEFVSSFGSIGSGDGQFKNPDEIEIDKLGNVWVGDQANHRVQLFDLAGAYKGKFGSAGSGPGQFAFAYPLGIAADSKGNLWIADPNNHRVQRWLVPVERPAYVSKFGSSGSGDGQLSFPADVAVGVDGSLLVVDKSNNRIQRFDKSGNYLGKFGSYGTGDGQFNRPTAVAVDRDGNLLVTDSNNHRVQKFSSDGQFIAKFGSAGAGNGQLSSPEGIATDFEGNTWVADSGNGRVQKFTEEGEFLAVLSSKGSVPGQLGKPIGIDIDPEGRIWVGDFQNHRVSVFEGDGDFVGQFGSLGTEPGQFNRPSAVEIDAHDNVWVADQVNGRVQRFDLDGKYVGSFGSKGTGEGQFSFPTINAPVGIATDRTGHIWVTDVNAHRIQQWMLGHYSAAETAPLDLSDGDPKVEVQTEGDLVASVAGNAAGTHSYEHEGDFLTSYEGPEGETLYEKNAAGLLSKVTLPNGTWAKIKYLADNRVQSVEVKLAGEASSKTTNFHYEDGPPRRSIVTPPGKPQITYDIAADGSVFKWWHKDSPPEIIALNGSLGFDKNGTEVAAGDLVLEVEGDSPHGVASIQIVANGNQLVSEKTCEQDPDPEIECERLEDLWVTDTASLSPGVLNIEVIVTNELGRSESKRWWVTIPHTPPPAPGAPVPPKFSEIQQFREEHGLEVIFPVANERELVERIFDLINAWHSPSSVAGQVARASWERWGVPLRPEDVAELEYRLAYWHHDSQAIEAWADSNAPGTFAGVFIDERAGGKIVVGFTSGQAEASLAALEQTAGLVAGPDRIVAMPSTPAHNLAYLEDLQHQVAVAATGYSPGLITGSSVDIPSNAVSVGASNVAQAQNALHGTLGQQVPTTVYYQPRGRELKVGRERIGGMVRAGDEILQRYPGGVTGPCTASFGAFEKAAKPGTGQPVLRLFALTAGHCEEVGQTVWRRSDPQPTEDEKQDIGKVGRSAYETPGDVAIDVDASAIRLDSPSLVPRQVFQAEGFPLIDVTSVWSPPVGTNLCFSGRTSRNLIRCGPVLGPPTVEFWEQGSEHLELCFKEYIWGGDSGSPVWVEGSGVAVGIAVSGYGGPSEPGLTPQEQSEAASDPEEACVSLLKPFPSRNPAASVFGSPDLAPLHLVTGSNAQP